MSTQEEPKDTAHTDGETSPLVIWGGAGAIIAAVALVFVLNHLGGEKAKVVAAGPQAVSVITLAPQDLAQIISVSGEARPKEDVRVFAPAAGVRILDLLVDEGAMVRQGQPLARLDARLTGAQTRAAEAAVAEARAASIRAEDEFKRAESIKDTGALSTEAIAARRAGAAAATARLRAAEAQLAEVEARLEGGYIRAPKAGLVIERTAQIGALVDGQILFRIAGGSALEIGAEIGEADMLAMKPGQQAAFKMVDGDQVTARLRRLPAAIDSKSRTGEAVFDLPAHPSLRAGMYLRGEALLPSKPSLAAPQTAFVYDGEQAFVFVVQAGNVAKRVAVRLGARMDEVVTIQSGVEPGARIVSAGASFLQDGDKVTPIEQSQLKQTGAVDLRGRG